MRKLSKRIALAACMVFSVLALTACSGSGGSKKEIDVAKTADELNSSVITTDQLCDHHRSADGDEE